LEKALHLKEKFLSGKTTIGSWMTLGHPAIAEIMSAAGFDWLTIDLEHSSMTLNDAENLIRVVALSGISPLVRLTSINKDQIKRVLDSGAEGLIVPMVNSYEDAVKAIEYSFYPPKGKRSFGLARAHGYGVKFEEHLSNNLNKTAMIVQIEHVDALKDLKRILSIEEIDAFMIGPYDLSGSMGIPGEFDNPKFLEVVDEINRIGSATDVLNGIHIVEPKLELLEAAKKEYKFIAYSVDTRMLDVTCRSAFLGEK
tara:strand:+ start:122 stop:883 length:762 start_codon:yes stop_codon:yes gene_type:complete